MKLTSHYDEWAWVDFVRGMARGDGRAAMEKHLSTGCERCLRIVRVLSGAAKATTSEPAYEPAPQIVRRAEAIFPVQRPQTAVLARLIYDSFREPLPAGMRAEDRGARHALYEAESVFVDLQLEHDRASGVVNLVGQVSDRQRPGSNGLDRPVSLLARKGLVASARCNHLGEFELEYQPVRDLRLYVPLRGAGKHVDVRLDELSPRPERRRPNGQTKGRKRNGGGR